MHAGSRVRIRIHVGVRMMVFMEFSLSIFSMVLSKSVFAPLADPVK